MNMIIQITTAIALILSIIVPFGCFFLGEKNKKRYKKSLIANCFMFFGVLLVATVVSFAGTASVQAAGSSADRASARFTEKQNTFPESSPAYDFPGADALHIFVPEILIIFIFLR